MTDVTNEADTTVDRSTHNLNNVHGLLSRHLRERATFLLLPAYISRLAANGRCEDSWPGWSVPSSVTDAESERCVVGNRPSLFQNTASHWKPGNLETQSSAGKAGAAPQTYDTDATCASVRPLHGQFQPAFSTSSSSFSSSSSSSSSPVCRQFRTNCKSDLSSVTQNNKTIN